LARIWHAGSSQPGLVHAGPPCLVDCFTESWLPRLHDVWLPRLHEIETGTR
jgi:hypothetical protein